MTLLNSVTASAINARANILREFSVSEETCSRKWKLPGGYETERDWTKGTATDLVIICNIDESIPYQGL
jgi:hypothetical protein